jgi:hypothetical protein
MLRQLPACCNFINHLNDTKMRSLKKHLEMWTNFPDFSDVNGYDESTSTYLDYRHLCILTRKGMPLNSICRPRYDSKSLDRADVVLCDWRPVNASEQQPSGESHTGNHHRLPCCWYVSSASMRTRSSILLSLVIFIMPVSVHSYTT